MTVMIWAADDLPTNEHERRDRARARRRQELRRSNAAVPHQSAKHPTRAQLRRIAEAAGREFGWMDR